MDETVVLIVRKDSDFTIDSLEDLKNLPKSLGVERGKVYGRAFENLRANDEAFAKTLEEVVEVNLIESMLEKGRISGFLGYGYNVFYRLKTDPIYANFTNHPFHINELSSPAPHFEGAGRVFPCPCPCPCPSPNYRL